MCKEPAMCRCVIIVYMSFMMSEVQFSDVRSKTKKCGEGANCFFLGSASRILRFTQLSGTLYLYNPTYGLTGGGGGANHSIPSTSDITVYAV